MRQSEDGRSSSPMVKASARRVTGLAQSCSDSGKRDREIVVGNELEENYYQLLVSGVIDSETDIGQSHDPLAMDNRMSWDFATANLEVESISPLKPGREMLRRQLRTACFMRTQITPPDGLSC